MTTEKGSVGADPKQQQTNIRSVPNLNGQGRDFEQFPLLDRDAVLNLPDPTWLIENVLVAGSVGVLYGISGIGKSFVAFDMGASIAAGLNWFEKNVRSGGVIYAVGESVLGFKKRWQAWEEVRGIAIPPTLRLSTRLPDLMDGDSKGGEAAKLATRIKKAEIDAGLIVVDTLARSMPGGDENWAKDMGRAISGADLLRTETGATVLLVHHIGKDGGKVERGSSALRGAADTMIHIAGTGSQIKKSSLLTLRCEKQRDAEPFEPIKLELSSYGDSLVPMPPDVEGDFVNDMLNALRAAGKPLTQTELVEILGRGTRRAEVLRRIATVAANPIYGIESLEGAHGAKLYSC